MRKHFWKSRTFKIWLVSSLLLLLLPIAANFSFLQVVQERLTEKALRINQLAIDQAAGVIDQKLTMLLNAADSIYVSSEIKRIKALSLPYTAEVYDELHRRAKYLANFDVQYDLYEYLYVYYSDMHCLMDSTRVYTDLNQISSIITARVRMSEDDFRALMAEPHYNDVCMLPENRVLFLRTLATRGAERKPIITLVSVMNTSSIVETLAQTAANTGGEAYMVNGEGARLGGSTLGEAEPSRSVSALSAYPGITYVLTVPERVFLLDVASVERLFFLLCGAALAASLFVGYAVTARNYKPLLAIKERVQAGETGKDDFALIDARITRILADENAMKREIALLNDAAGKRAFHLLLQGRMRELAALGPDQAPSFRGDTFVAVAFFADESAEAWPAEETERRFEAGFRALSGDGLEISYCQENSRPVAILCFEGAEADKDAQARARSVAERLSDALAQQYRAFPYRAYIGDARVGMENICLSLRNAIRAKDYAEFSRHIDGRIVPYDTMMYASHVSWKSFDIMDAERSFSQLMLQGDYAKGEAQLHEIMAYYGQTEGMSLYVMRCRMFGVMNMMLNVLHEIEPDLDPVLYEGLSPVEALLSASTPAELETVALAIVGKLVGRQETRETGAGSKAEPVKRYIAANYSDPNLSVQAVADAFKLSLSYLSRTFKKEYGIGVLDYINRYRLEKAKELMRLYEGATLSSIAESVGFISSQTLIRAFKRYDGVTPSQFRASLAAEKAGEAAPRPESKI